MICEYVYYMCVFVCVFFIEVLTKDIHPLCGVLREPLGKEREKVLSAVPASYSVTSTSLHTSIYNITFNTIYILNTSRLPVTC